MPRLTVPYTNGYPILRVALSAGGAYVPIAGVVDSGADKSLLPKSLASSLGIPESDLVQTNEGSGGAGNAWFPTWVLPYPLRARVIVPFEPPRGVEPWGPELQLTPEFAKDTVSLLGRGDFFRAFTVTFEQPAGDHFHLDHD